MFRKYPKNFQDPHIDYPIHDLELSFSDYIKQTNNLIQTHRQDLLGENAAAIIEANTPFELLPSGKSRNVGILFIHGLLDSPFITRDIAKSLQNQGFITRSILLPGHGMRPGSLLQVTYEDWLQSLYYGVTSLTKVVEKIILIGFSTGAVLSAIHTLLRPEKIAGIVMLSPAIKINSFFDFATNWHKVFSWLIPRAKWMSAREENDYVKYSSTTYNAAYQVYRLTRTLKKMSQTTPLTCPVFMGLSYEDKIVSSLAAIQYFLSLPSPHNQMILYASKQLNYKDKRIILRSGAYPEWHIKNFCHISIPIAPDNIHYGMNGDYPLASHVNRDNNIIYEALDIPTKKFYDLLYKLNLTSYQHQRLTFNPDFDFLSQKIKEFAEKL